MSKIGFLCHGRFSPQKIAASFGVRGGPMCNVLGVFDANGSPIASLRSRCMNGDVMVQFGCSMELQLEIRAKMMTICKLKEVCKSFSTNFRYTSKSWI